MTTTYDRPMPNSAEAERAILGAIMLDGRLIDQARRVVPVDHFWVGSHREIYLAMLKLRKENKEINPILIGEELKKTKRLEMVGGISYITNLSYGLPHSTNVAHYAEVLRGHAKARWVIRFADDLVARLQDGFTHPDEIVKQAIEQLSETNNDSRKLRRPRSLDELYEDYAYRLLLFHKGVSNAIPTGFYEIDKHLLGGGLVPSFTYVLAARTSMGKTTLALDITANAGDQGFRVHFVTREMLKESIMDRLVSAKSGVVRSQIQPGISKRDYDRAVETAQVLRMVPIVLDDTSLSVVDIDMELGEAERSGRRVDLLVVDYLQLMGGDGDNRTGEVSSVSRGLKGLAMKYEIPVIEVSQLTRAPGRENREPEVYDLRESGQIEQDADVIMFLHGDESEEGITFMEKHLLCKKQREGALFREPMDMNAGLVTFRKLEQLSKKGGRHEEKPVQKKAGAQAASEDEGSLGF